MHHRRTDGEPDHHVEGDHRGQHSAAVRDGDRRRRPEGSRPDRHSSADHAGRYTCRVGARADIFDECSTGAAAAGVRLTFTADPTGYTTADGRYELIYPFTFLDGHDDPYAIYNCTLTDNTVTSKYVGGGLSDSH